jgi:hypothetical protein
MEWRLFCPKCGDEFVAGITVCPDCALSLVDELPSQGAHESPEADEFVTVATFGSLFEASIARGALEADGLSAYVPGENAGSFTQNRSGLNEVWVQLQVRASDRDRAVELLRQAGHQ